ncbi:Uncharacterised protein [Serratia liquefaciens]|nr:Uncharacterised protein [Serratia liquefaciens]
MEAVLRIVAIALELIIQGVKTHEANERQRRIDYARDNPADYLRRFGRVRTVTNDTDASAVRGDKAGPK